MIFISNYIFTFWYFRFFFSSFNLLIGWQLSIWNCCKPFLSLLYNCQLLCCWRLALSTVVEACPRPFFPGCCSFKDVYYKLVTPNCMPYPWVASIFLIFKINLSSFPLWTTSPFVILSVHFVSSILLQHLVSNAFTILSSFFFLGSIFLIHKEQHPKYNFFYVFFISKLRLFEQSSWFLLLNITLASLICYIMSSLFYPSSVNILSTWILVLSLGRRHPFDING